MERIKRVTTRLAAADCSDDVVQSFEQLLLLLDLDFSDEGLLASRSSRSRSAAVCDRVLSELSDTCHKQRRLFQALVDKAAEPWYAQPDDARVARPFRVVVVGAGPVGLRTAIELALTGCNVTLIERRSLGSFEERPNLITLWKSFELDLENLGVPNAFTRDGHIGTKDLQLGLLRAALLLGVRLLPATEYQSVVASGGAADPPGSPSTERGRYPCPYRAECTHKDTFGDVIDMALPLDLLVGADGATGSLGRKFGFGRDHRQTVRVEGRRGGGNGGVVGTGAWWGRGRCARREAVGQWGQLGGGGRSAVGGSGCVVLVMKVVHLVVGGCNGSGGWQW